MNGWLSDDGYQSEVGLKVYLVFVCNKIHAVLCSADFKGERLVNDVFCAFDRQAFVDLRKPGMLCQVAQQLCSHTAAVPEPTAVRLCCEHA